MTNPANLKKQPFVRPSSNYMGEFASSPASLSEHALVIIYSWDRNQSWGPYPWMPRGDVLPLEGDKCIIAIDQNGEPWGVVGWEPADAV